MAILMFFSLVIFVGLPIAFLVGVVYWVDYRNKSGDVAKTKYLRGKKIMLVSLIAFVIGSGACWATFTSIANGINH